ncbi:MAG TPA: NAD(P)/FAD-dependent oxidoreductase [Acidobacteriota bacterium]|jgi:L-2-hydroxyglutarate oxidase LhgO
MTKYKSGAVIGAGVVGLAIAAELSAAGLCDELWVLEKEASFGRGTSSRNSEVIHAGLYYPPSSLKARLCVEGRERIYDLCRRHQIVHRPIGKLIVAADDQEVANLNHIEGNARACGVPIEQLSQEKIRSLEPAITCCSALYSPRSGIVDSHGLMQHFHRQAARHNTEFVFNTAVTGIARQNGRYLVETQTVDGEPFTLEADLVVNAAGLYSDQIASLAGFRYQLHYCKGCYFSVNQSKAHLCSHLIYPAVGEHSVSLGVHVGFDLTGRMRLGPDAHYIERNEDYSVPIELKDPFYEAAHRYLPFLEPEDLAPEMSGIRPKLQGPGEPFADFVIRQDLPQFINCVGIDSPGLTSSPAIASYVRSLVQ